MSNVVPELADDVALFFATCPGPVALVQPARALVGRRVFPAGSPVAATALPSS